MSKSRIEPSLSPDVSDPFLERPSTVPWPPILLVGAVGLPVILGHLVPLDWPGLDDAPARLIGRGFLVAGVALLAWAGLTLARQRTTILPHRGAEHLVTSGPYAISRNPIYVADTLILLGLAEITKNVWFVPAALAFALLVRHLAVLPEERHLAARFGDAWRHYAETTRRWL